jgi:hypothetical protein
MSQAREGSVSLADGSYSVAASGSQNLSSSSYEAFSAVSLGSQSTCFTRYSGVTAAYCLLSVRGKNMQPFPFSSMPAGPFSQQLYFDES